MGAQRRYHNRDRRADGLRPRVEDIVTLLAHGHRESGLLHFAKLCKSAAAEQGFRRFDISTLRASNPDLEAEACVLGLRRFLGDNGQPTAAVGWVMDIYEAGINAFYRGLPRPLMRVPDPAVEQIEAETVGVQAFAPAAKPLAQRLLEAYLARDDDLFLELVQELER